MRRLRRIALAVGAIASLAGCGKYFWESPGRGFADFVTERDVCIQEATGGKYGAGSEDVFRACMKARGWARVITHYPTPAQFRGPEDVDEFATPPHPLAKRYELPERK